MTHAGTHKADLSGTFSSSSWVVFFLSRESPTLEFGPLMRPRDSAVFAVVLFAARQLDPGSSCIQAHVKFSCHRHPWSSLKKLAPCRKSHSGEVQRHTMHARF